MKDMNLRKVLRYVMLGLAGALIALPAGAEDPYTAPNNSWISLSGEVKSVTPNTFVLDYGDSSVTVEMDDGDRDADAYKLIAGDKVTVYGYVDDDLYETTTIEAASVYVEKLGTWFYASGIDEEDRDVFVTTAYPVVPGRVTVQGTVTEVKMDEFVIDTGLRHLTVEVDEMAYNPLDDEGYQKIQEGQRVSVTGEMDTDLFEGRELEASSIITIIG
jgi:uncharacterized protein YdeI (BOF family)